MKWLEIDQDNLCMKFSALNVDFFGSSSPERASKMATPLKNFYFTAIILYSVKTIADRYIHAAYHNKQ